MNLLVLPSSLPLAKPMCFGLARSPTSAALALLVRASGASATSAKATTVAMMRVIRMV